MDNSLKFQKYRKEYKEFYFNSYNIKEDNEAIYIEYEFEIPKLTKFNPKIKILKKDFNFKNIHTRICTKYDISYRTYRTYKLLEKYMFS